MIFVNRDRRSLGQFTEQEVSNGLNSGELLPEDLAWQEGMAAWAPLSTFTHLPPPGVISLKRDFPPATTPSGESFEKPGRIRFDECLTKGWACFQKNWGLCVVVSLVFFAISMLVQTPAQFAQVLFEKFTGRGSSAEPWMAISAGVVFFFFWAVGSGVSAILSAGFMVFFIEALKTGKTNIDHLFSGFRATVWIQILLAMAAWAVTVMALAVILLVPGIFLASSMKSSAPVIVAVLLLLIPVLYLSASLGFVFPFIVDRKASAREAIVTCVKTVHRQWFAAFGLLMLIGLIASSGLILCCVGILATLPLGYLIWCQGYRQLFGDREA